MTDGVKQLAGLLAETDGLIADIESGLDEMSPAEAEKMRLLETEMKLIRDQIESLPKKN
jgi:ABC-type thiamine transport system substrate-binding protein